MGGGLGPPFTLDKFMELLYHGTNFDNALVSIVDGSLSIDYSAIGAGPPGVSLTRSLPTATENAKSAARFMMSDFYEYYGVEYQSPQPPMVVFVFNRSELGDNLVHCDDGEERYVGHMPLRGLVGLRANKSDIMEFSKQIEEAANNSMEAGHYLDGNYQEAMLWMIANTTQ